MDVAIVGLGLHPFGRSPTMNGLEQGAAAARAALADAGTDFKAMQFAFGGSQDGGNADSLVNLLGLTGLQFTNIWNGCATGGSSLNAAYSAIKAGQYDVGLVVGFDKHPRGAFNPMPSEWGLDDWYGETGLMLTTQFFAMKIQRYMHDHGISRDTLVKVAEKAFRNGSVTPTAWRQTALSAEEIEQAPMVSEPLNKYMFCSPAEGGCALVVCRADLAQRFTSSPVYLKTAVVRSRNYGSFEVFAPSQAPFVADSPTVTASTAAFELAGIGPEDVDVAQLQDTEVGAEIMHMAENGFCGHGDQEKWIAEGRTEIGGSLPVNTDGGCLANGEPVGASGLRQVYEICQQLRGSAGARQVPGEPNVGYTHVYGAPGISGVNILSV
ncbi:MAG: thiolase family protein [Pseudomonadota bacterium]